MICRHCSIGATEPESSGSPFCSALLALSSLAGCAIYPRFDSPDVVSLNPLATDPVPALRERELAWLEGSWVATNMVQRPAVVSPTVKPGPSTNEPPLARNINPGSESTGSKRELIGVVTTLVFEKCDPDDGTENYYSVTIETHAGSARIGRTAYLARVVRLKNAVFADLQPDFLAHLSAAEQAVYQHYLPVHWFLKFEQKGSSLELARMNEQWCQQFLLKKPRAVVHARQLDTTGVVLTDRPEALRKFLERIDREAEAFRVTTFQRAAAEAYPAAILKTAVGELVDVLNQHKTELSLSRDEVLIRTHPIDNRTPTLFDTKYMDCVLRRRLDKALDFKLLDSYLDWIPDSFHDAAGRICDFNLSGVLLEVPGDQRTEERKSAFHLLRLTLSDRQRKVVWQEERALDRSALPVHRPGFPRLID